MTQFILFVVYGNDITGSSGQVASPLYPRTYPNNADYRWTITVNGDSYVEMQFLDIDIEDLSNCYYDKLKVCIKRHSLAESKFRQIMVS